MIEATHSFRRSGRTPVNHKANFSELLPSKIWFLSLSPGPPHHRQTRTRRGKGVSYLTKTTLFSDDRPDFHFQHTHTKTVKKWCSRGQASTFASFFLNHMIIHLSSERKKKGSTDNQSFKTFARHPFALLLFSSESGDSWLADMTHVKWHSIRSSFDYLRLLEVDPLLFFFLSIISSLSLVPRGFSIALVLHWSYIFSV